MKVSLIVNGREMIFSDEELVDILEKYYADLEIKNSNKKVIAKPTEGEWFEVNPKTINQKLFQSKRDDIIQEDTRQQILKAFDEVKRNPEQNKPFETFMPTKTWEAKNLRGFRDLAKCFGDRMATRVEYYLELAQRISNGESWEAICNEPDTANWFRVVEFGANEGCFCGGSRCSNVKDSAAMCYDRFHDTYVCYKNAVPLVVRYK